MCDSSRMSNFRWDAAAFVAVFSLNGAGCAPQRAPAPGDLPGLADPAAAPEPAPRPSGANDSWMGEVRARIRDASHAFVADGGGFLAEVPERGLAGRFDADGAHLTLDEDSVSLRTVGVGRGEVEGALPAAPGLGACIEDMNEPGGDCVRRLEYGGADVTEWWTSREEGFEQGWTVDAAPEGDGPLTMEIAVEGAEATVGEGEIWLQGDAGGLLMVNGLEAWDADGVPLQARFERTEEGFRVRVEDGGARYPVEIDPVYTTAGWTVAGGGAIGGSFGYSVASVGDVNGDGFGDIAVSSLDYGAAQGAVYSYQGGGRRHRVRRQHGAAG